MKKACLLYIILMCLCACGNKNTNVINLSGEIKGLGNDTLYIYGIDKTHDRIDTLIAHEDRFSDTLSVDTLVMAVVQFSNGYKHPLFLNKGNQIQIKGSYAELTALHIDGNKHNEELTQFNEEMKGLGTPSERIQRERAEAFIYEHPSSLASIYLLDKYFVRIANPSTEQIKKLTEQMTGELKDQPYIQSMLEKNDKDEKLMVGKTVPYFHLRNAEGKDITRTTMKNQYLLLHFWASWDSLSMEQNKVLRRIYNKQKKNTDFAMIGVSLDLDKETWLKVIETDTLKWEQTCDFAGWNSEVVEKLCIRRIPTSLFISPTGKIEAKDMDEETIEKRLEQIKEEKKRKEEREKKKEAERKKKK